MTRLQATVALLEAWGDYFPWPATWTGDLQRRSTTAGPAPFYVESCTDCGGRGKRKGGWVCQTCKGEGKLWRDAYTGERVARHEPEESPERFRESFRELLRLQFVNCSSCGGWGRLSADSNARPTNAHAFCDDCQGTGRVPAPFTGVFRADTGEPERERSGDAELDALELGHEKRDRLRVYKQHLAPALEHLRDSDGYGHFLVCWVWILGAQTAASLPPERLARLLSATRAIEAEMPDKLEKKVPGEIRAQHDHQQAARVRAKGKTADKFAQRARDDEIRRLHRGGASLDALATRYELDKSRISRITRQAA